MLINSQLVGGGCKQSRHFLKDQSPSLASDPQTSAHCRPGFILICRIPNTLFKPCSFVCIHLSFYCLLYFACKALCMYLYRIYKNNGYILFLLRISPVVFILGVGHPAHEENIWLFFGFDFLPLPLVFFHFTLGRL